MIAGGAIAAVLLIPRAGWNTNDITTGDGTYPDLTTRRYDAPPDMVAAFAAQAATRLLKWRVVDTDTQAGRVTLEVPVAGGIFTDDVTVSSVPDGQMTRAVIRSHSRLGRGDLGVNARHIRALQAVMDDKLPAAPP